MSRIKALTPGGCVVLPGGFKNGLLLYVLQCDSFDECTLAVCSSGDGLEFHPARIDPATGAAQFNSPLLFRRIPSMRVRDGAVWFMLLRSAIMSDAKQTATLLYSQVLPFLNSRPLLSNITQAEAQVDTAVGASGGGGSVGGVGASGTNSASAGTLPLRWWTPRTSGDPYGYDLCSLAACCALQMARAAEDAIRAAVSQVAAAEAAVWAA